MVGAADRQPEGAHVVRRRRQNWGLGVVVPKEIVILGSFRKADVPIRSKAHVRSGNLVSDSRSDHGKVFVLRVLHEPPRTSPSGTHPLPA